MANVDALANVVSLADMAVKDNVAAWLMWLLGNYGYWANVATLAKYYTTVLQNGLVQYYRDREYTMLSFFCW